MILKNGLDLEWTKSSTYQEQNLKWFATSTANITNIHIIYLAPAPQRQ
tara:strand:+ start:381 stop:524 length:144 start_codon:yes stop_codon:yes gene_type:complete